MCTVCVVNMSAEERRWRLGRVGRSTGKAGAMGQGHEGVQEE